jgi:hypothetical protein
MSLNHFSRLSQSIRDAAELADKDKDKAQKAATLVVNSVGVMSTPKRTARPADFAHATDVIGNAIKTAREAKQANIRNDKKAGTEQAAKSLAELLTETAAEDQENE